MQSSKQKTTAKPLYPPRRAAVAEPDGVQLLYVCFNGRPGRYFGVSKSPHYIGFFEVLKLLYPPKGAAVAEPDDV